MKPTWNTWCQIIQQHDWWCVRMGFFYVHAANSICCLNVMLHRILTQIHVTHHHLHYKLWIFIIKCLNIRSNYSLILLQQRIWSICFNFEWDVCNESENRKLQQNSCISIIYSPYVIEITAIEYGHMTEYTEWNCQAEFKAATELQAFSLSVFNEEKKMKKNLALREIIDRIIKFRVIASL